MTRDPHFAGLERLYLRAPINDFYQPTIDVSEGRAVIEIEVDGRFFHAAHAVHGSVYFKMLDDAAFFAASSLERSVFVLTSTFTTYMTRPVSSGRIRSDGRVVNQTRSQLIAEAVAYDAEGHEIGRGMGAFLRSKVPLTEVPGYGAE